MLSRLLSKSPATPTDKTVQVDAFTIRIKPHPRARSLTLRYKAAQNHFVLTVPKRLSHKQAMAFLNDQTSWMHAQTRNAQHNAPEQRDGHILIEDRWRRIEHHDGAGVHIALHDDYIVITCRHERIQRALQRFIKQHALDTVTHLAREKAARIDAVIDSIAVRDTTSRWGSCSHDGRLSFSWRLIMAPPEVIDYVVAHEVAHLRHFDHSTQFWALCRALSEHYTKGKHWLQLNGQSLHHRNINLQDSSQV